MSAFFGDFSRTDQPIDPEVLSRMAAVIPWYGLDGRGQWSSAQVGLGHLLHCVSPESRHEQQPLMQDNGRVVLAANARLDNRRELIDQLRLMPASDAPLTDPELILAAYTAWGEDCPAHLLGDFAFALWDDDTQQAGLRARSDRRRRPSTITSAPNAFVFANDIRVVLAHPAVPDALNDMRHRHAPAPSPVRHAGDDLPGRREKAATRRTFSS
jgi:asparagine synthase (glutamine-hydrolysing)